MQLAAAYVARHVELGWAVTGYGNQGDTTDHGICVVEPSSTRAGIYVGMTRGRGRNIALVADPTGLEDAEETFAAAIARPANARTALAVRARLAGEPVVTVSATGPPAPAAPAAGPVAARPVGPCPDVPDAAAGPVAARLVEPCPAEGDGATRSTMASVPRPDATPGRSTLVAAADSYATAERVTPGAGPDATAPCALPAAVAGPVGAAPTASTPASASSEEPAGVEEDDLAARMARRLSEMETRRPPARTRRR